MTVVLLTAVLGYLGKLDAQVALVFSAALAAYNWSNLREAQSANSRNH
jgi:hypothetical protein